MTVLIYLENWSGKFKKSSFELVSYGSQLAKKMSGNLTVLSIGEVSNDELKNLGKYGATSVLSAKTASSLDDKSFAGIIADAAQKAGASVVVMGNSFTGKALAPRVAVRLKAGLVSAVNGLAVSVSPFVVKKKAFSGKSLV